MKRLLLIPIILLWFCSIGWADTHTAASCENKTGQTDVQDAITASADGDTVAIPAGSCTWDTAVTVNKAITITGQSRTSPTITAATGKKLFVVTLNKPAGEFQLTKMALVGSAPASSGDVYLDGIWAKARINEINWSSASSRAIMIGTNFFNLDRHYFGTTYDITHQKVLVDNINYTTTTPRVQFLYIWGRNHLAWQEDDGYGTDNFVFLENCTLTWNLTSQYGVVTDTEAGARFVARYNTITNGYFAMHDYANERGNRLVEIYNNLMTDTIYDMYGFNATRGGTGIFHHNTLIGVTNLNNPMIYRVGQSNAIRFPGYTCAQTDTLKTCQDGKKHCTGGTKAGYPCYSDGQCPGSTCKTVYTCDSDAECKDSLGNTLPCMQVDGDAANGYPCRDQGGRGKDNASTGVQESSPIYWYSNTVNGAANTAYSVGGYGAYLTLNTDYCNHDPSTDCGSKSAWTYTTYTCPHPWAGSGTCGATAGTAGYSTGSVAPTLTSATLAADGTTLSLLFSRAITATINTGVTVTPSSGTATAAYASGSTSTTLVYTLSRAISSTENGGSLTVSYTQPGNGLEATDDAADVLSFSNTQVINNSTQGNTLKTVTPSASAGCYIIPNTAQSVVSGLTTSFTYLVGANYQFTTWGGTCGGTGTTTYTTSAITADCTVTVSCTKIAADAKVGTGNPGQRVGAGNPAHKRY